MLTSETKRHVDAARQVLVGVVPNPTSQIDQITNALIYKFMDDMDQAAIKAGGSPSFFIGDLERYAWTRIMDARLGNQERMNMYSEALLKFSEAKQLPQLFRDIFKSAFLPYRSPEVLGLFLKEISCFDYSHPEDLGDGYEYLLSIMSSQGDAGQFRTPRHIIDFIVDVVNPTKDDKVLDPACGTGGFLVSSYKHILEQHDGKDGDGKPNNEKPLTPDNRKKLIQNFEGYDIDPGMQRIAQVNMYLHQFKNPKIYQYDTLGMDERWGDKFDVILANPPFMSPKGGVRPHSKFSVQSSRSEVLFVDYIMNHLRPKGRAGVIVPEGIIFQSGSAHKQLRENLVKDGLYAVVSLPSGVFQPYSGVKTSILLFDNEIAKQRSEILFVKIIHDGTDLGAKKRATEANDLPVAVEAIQDFQKGKFEKSKIAHSVSKQIIVDSGDYNLSGDQYKTVIEIQTKFTVVELGEILEEKNVKVGNEFSKYKVATISSQHGGFIDQEKYFNKKVASDNRSNYKVVKNGWIGYRPPGLDIGTIGLQQMADAVIVSPLYAIFSVKNELVRSDYLISILQSENFKEIVKPLMMGAARPMVGAKQFLKIKIPLPPLEVQKQIVAELDGYAGIIAGAKQIAKNWKPKIDIDPEWEKVNLGDACDVRDGTHDSPKQVQEGYPLITSKNIKDGQLDFSNISYISEEDFKKVSQRSYVDVGDIIMPMIGTIGGSCLIKTKKIEFAIKNVALFKKTEKIIPEYLLSILDSDLVATMFENQSAGATQKFVSLGVLRGLEIPLPPLEVQKQIVEKIEAEHALVESAKKLIDIYEGKTKDAIAKLWEE